MSSRARIADICSELSNESVEYYESPIKTSNGDLSGRPNLFKYYHHNFIKETRRLFIDYLRLSEADSSPNMKAYASEVLGMVTSVISKIRAYENARDCFLLHREYLLGPNRGQRVLHRSAIAEFEDFIEDESIFLE